MVKNNISIALGLCFGAALGTPIGAALHHIGIGMVLGVAFGLLIGAVISSRKQHLN
jgi:uncharacterized membrane protein YoaK (UPF0700 family)